MAVRIVRLGSPRVDGEGVRIGTVRRPPRGVPKAQFASRDYYDVWLPNLAPTPELVKLARGMTPLANNWYTKAITDHLLFNQLQEMMSPGYLAKVRARASREFGQGFYWAPQNAAPDRAPNLSAIRSSSLSLLRWLLLLLSSLSSSQRSS